ncbi:MAG: DUF3352 domain-containing protein [Armatimonadota bacterium]
MNTKKIFVLIAIIMATSFLRAQAAADLMKFVPADWPAIIRVDCSSATTSGAFLKSVNEKPDYKDIQQLNQSFYSGMRKLFSAMGVDLPEANGAFVPWWGEQMVIATDPTAKTPGVIVAIASKDRAMAEQTLSEIMGSVIRDSDPVVQDVGGTKIVTWKVAKAKMELAYAVGDGFVLFADSAARIRTALTTPAGPSQAMLDILQQHSGDVVAFVVDAAPIVKGMNKNPQKTPDKEDLMVVAAGQIKAHGGLAFSEKGALLTLNGDLPAAIMGMAGTMIPMGAPTSDLAALLPKSSLAAAFVSSATPLGMMQEQIKSVGADMQSINAVAGMVAAAGESPVAIALQGFIPEASFVAVCQKSTAAEATEMMARWQDKLGEQGLKGTPQAEYTKLTSKKSASETAGYARQVGSAVIFGSDWRSAQKASAITAQNSLAARTSYADVRSLLGAPQAVDAWVSLDAISAVGYLYESLVGREMAVIRPLLDAVKGTEGVGVSVGMTPKGAVAKFAIKTTIAPQSPIFSAYMTAVPVLSAVLFPVFARAKVAAQNSTSMSNLKQLAVALQIYSVDYGDKLPPSKTWKKVLTPYLAKMGTSGEAFVSPSGVEYQYNYKLAGLSMGSILNPAELVVFFEGYGGRPVGPEALAFQNGTANVAYLDGHVSWLPTAPGIEAFKPKLAPAKPAKKAPTSKPLLKKTR